RAAAPAAGAGAVLACLYGGAGRADDAQGLPCAIRSDRGSRQNAIPDTSAHAATWLRLCPGERGPRHTGATGLARAQEHPAHGALHRAVAASVQGLLALLDRRSRHRSCPRGWGSKLTVLARAVPCAVARTHSKRRASNAAKVCSGKGKIFCSV